MQIHRLFETVYILLMRRHVTAGELSERFGVTRRTIYRDIEALSLAGIPVYTSKGFGGGIGLLDQYTLDRSLLDREEQSEIISALQALEAVSPDEPRQVLTKLSALFHRESQQWVSIDFSDWSGTQKELFGTLKTTIIEKRQVVITYCSSQGVRSERTVEPLQLCFKHQAWYLRGYCRTRRDLRFFKLSRIEQIRITQTRFEEPPAHTPLPEEHTASSIRVELLIDESMGYRVYDEFLPSQIQKRENGFKVIVDWPESDWVYGYIMSYGDKAEVLSPSSVRREIGERFTQSAKRYR